MSHVDEQNLVEEEEVESSQNSEKVLMILLTVLLLVMLSSGFLVYKFVLAKSVDENLLTRIGPVYETDEFIVNFSGSTKHFIKTQLALELSNKK
jgi:flagellar basal body-associated protein FliL